MQNILLISELLPCLPFTTAKVECAFSTMKVIKTERRTNLNCSTDLLEVSVEGPTFSDFSSDSAVDFWWHDCSSGRRVNQRPHKVYFKQKEGSSFSDTHTTGDSESEQVLDLDTWG